MCLIIKLFVLHLCRDICKESQLIILKSTLSKAIILNTYVMEKPKYDIPFTFVDTRGSKSTGGQQRNTSAKTKINKELQVLQASPKEVLAVQHGPINLELLLERFMMILQFLLQQLWQKVNRFFKIRSSVFSKVRLPWFKIGLVLFAAYILLNKDMQFNVALRAPLSVFPDDSESYNKSNIAYPASVKKERHNPYAPTAADNMKTRKVKTYIRKHAETAVAEMHKYGIPASIKMAQALVESNSGASKLAKNNNNHFGIKCFSKKCRKGHCTNAYDDHHKDFFRKYGKAKDSWRAHSLLLSQGRYKKLHKHGKDYQKWSKGLKEVGYATDKNYAQKLINVIKKYDLHQLDKL